LSDCPDFKSDTGSFGSLQALPSFLRQFGVQNAKGDYELPTQRASLMNSVPWIGKLAGCFLIEPLIDRVGYRSSIIVTAVIQIISLIIEMTSKTWQQFTIGRNFAYLSVGLVRLPHFPSLIIKAIAPFRFYASIAGADVLKGGKPGAGILRRDRS
jgi:MFS family permease